MNKPLCSPENITEGRPDRLRNGAETEADQLVAKILAEHLRCAPSDFSRETKLEQLGIDSVERVELIMKLEDAADTTLCLEAQPRTVGDLADLLLRV